MENRFMKSALALAILASTCIGPIGYAENAPVKLNCFLTDQMTVDKKPGEPKDTFTTTSPAVYAICTTPNLQKGQSLTAEWIATNTHKILPDNYKIQDKKVPVPELAHAGENITFDFGLSKPAKDWPAGQYRVNFYVDDQKTATESLNFIVSANKTTE